MCSSDLLAVGDMRFQKKCLGKMGDVAKAGRTVVLVTHQMNQIRRLCHRVLWIDEGSARRDGSPTDVVGAYEIAMSSSDRDSSQQSSSRNSKAKFLSWRILEPESSSPHTLESVGPVSFAFLLDVRAPLRCGHQGIALFDVDRRLMWAFANDSLSLDPGIHELVYNFPFLPLCPRSYNWQLSLWDEEGNVDLWEALPELQVSAPNYQHALDEWNGVLNVPSTFTISAKKG